MYLVYDTLETCDKSYGTSFLKNEQTHCRAPCFKLWDTIINGLIHTLKRKKNQCITHNRGKLISLKEDTVDTITHILKTKQKNKCTNYNKKIPRINKH